LKGGLLDGVRQQLLLASRGWELLLDGGRRADGDDGGV